LGVVDRANQNLIGYKQQQQLTSRHSGDVESTHPEQGFLGKFSAELL
jgi:hypothetical protein